MKYQVSKKGSSVTFKFETYEEAVDFCNTMIFWKMQEAQNIHNLQ